VTSQIKFAPFISFQHEIAIIAEADLGIVSLGTDIYKVAFPSKVLTYLGLAVPVLALVEPDSNLASELVYNKLGVCAQTNTVEGVAEAVEQFLKSGSSKEHVADWYEKNAGLPIILKQWDNLMSDGMKT
jgi:hypothetical protein